VLVGSYEFNTKSKAHEHQS